jgi:hypothetical protein
MVKNDLGPLPYTTHKSELKMDHTLYLVVTILSNNVLYIVYLTFLTE